MATHAAGGTPCSSAARRYGSGAGLVCSVSPADDDEAEGVEESRAAQHQLDLVAPRARRDPERPRRREPAHAGGRRRIEDVAARDERLEPPRLLRDQHLDLFVAEQEVVVDRNLLEDPLIVEAQVLRLVCRVDRGECRAGSSSSW